MTSQLKPIKVWGQGGPNPPKVAMIIEELGLPHEIIAQKIKDVKSPEYLAINPNGRIPAIEDPNTGITLWESGAIIEYLIEKYDEDNSISFAPGTTESYLTKQWLYLQTTGQGPYFGQASWFEKFHHEAVPSAKKRYNDEVNRLTGVLEGHLTKQKELYGEGDGPWLVGNKLTYADIAFVPWQKIISMIIGKEDFDEDKYPVVKEWLDELMARKAVSSVFAAAMAAPRG